MAFSTSSEIQTLAALNRVLSPRGYQISQKARVLDVVEAAAASPEATTPSGSTLGDRLPPLLRAEAGPFRPTHPWLHPGDWDYAFKSHFDFIVHTPLGEKHQTHPLFAVEFDGPHHHHPGTRLVDCRKNRLCVASGLLLVRLDQNFLLRQERLVLVAWLAELWESHRREMPRLIRERNATAEEMTDADWEEMGDFLYPELDVNLLFKLAHPYPPAITLANRLARRHGFVWHAITRFKVDNPRWRVGLQNLPFSLYNHSLTERWESNVNLEGPAGQTAHLQASVDVRSGYPLDLDDQSVEEQWAVFLAGKMPCLPAGPWLGAHSILGEALCLYAMLREIEQWLRRNDRAR
ncbi:MAG TPA: hypothetical protein VKL22_00810 [Actinomycetota bacterium]|nr:hypothetical protein [Actinomycetota bacterium]